MRLFIHKVVSSYLEFHVITQQAGGVRTATVVNILFSFWKFITPFFAMHIKCFSKFRQFVIVQNILAKI